MHLEYLFTVAKFWQFDIDLPVETTSPKQSLVQDIGPIGRGQDDHAAIAAEAVHLGKQLVECALALVVTAQVGLVATGTSHGIDLVDKDDAGGFFLGLAEEIPYPGCSDADKHLDEVGTRH